MSTEVTVRQLNRETFKVLEMVEKEGGVVITRGGDERYELVRSGDMTRNEKVIEFGSGSKISVASAEDKVKAGVKLEGSDEFLKVTVSPTHNRKLCKHGFPLGLCKKGCK